MLHKIGQRGVAAAEFALVAPVLVLLLLGSFDIANAVQTSIHLERAARAGAQYAVANSSDMSAIRDRVIADWPELTAAEVPLPYLACECAAAAVTCSQSCPSGLVQTITVTAQRSLTPYVLQSIPRRTGSAVVRLR